MDHRQGQCGISLVLSDRRQDSDPAIFDFENSLDRIAIIVPDFDPVQTVDHDLIHFIGDSMISISGQAIDAGSHEEMCTSVLSRAKEFIDVALAITDMDAPPRIIEKVGGLFQIFQPPNAFFLLDGNARLIDLSFEGGGSFEFLPRPEFDRCHSKREPFGRNSETRMHQNSASRMRFGAAGEISSTVGDALRNADQLRPLSLIGELCCVVKHKHKAVCRHCAVAGRLKMTGKNVRLTSSSASVNLDPEVGATRRPIFRSMALLESEHFVSPSINEKISASVNHRTPDNFLPRPSNRALSLTVLILTWKRSATACSEYRFGKREGDCNPSLRNGHGSRSFMNDQSIFSRVSIGSGNKN